MAPVSTGTTTALAKYSYASAMTATPENCVKKPLLLKFLRLSLLIQYLVKKISMFQVEPVLTVLLAQPMLLVMILLVSTLRVLQPSAMPISMSLVTFVWHVLPAQPMPLMMTHPEVILLAI
jgi:hypothetical protein